MNSNPALSIVRKPILEEKKNERRKHTVRKLLKSHQSGDFRLKKRRKKEKKS